MFSMQQEIIHWRFRNEDCQAQYKLIEHLWRSRIWDVAVITEVGIILLISETNVHKLGHFVHNYLKKLYYF